MLIHSVLGRTGTMHDTSDTEGTTVQWITYWKDLAGLQKFASATPHRTGWQGWNAGKYPHVGLMHELYNVPKGSYEAIYGDFPKWGLGEYKLSKRLHFPWLICGWNRCSKDASE